jgi:hypothetical protein
MTREKYKKVYPQSRLRWSELSRSRGIDTKGMMTRFYSRFAMANGFRGIVFDGYSPSSVRGYSALLRLQLAYSAFDVFVKAVNSFESQLGRKKKEIYEYTLINIELAEQLKQRHQLITYLMRMCTSPSIVRRMHLFIGDVPLINDDEKLSEKLLKVKNDIAKGKEVEIVKGDILFIAASLRHGVAHGDMSLHSVGVEKSSVVRLIDLLTKQVLDLCEKEFDLICEEVALLPTIPSTSIEISAQ